MARYSAPYRLLKPTTKGGNYYYRLGNDPKRIRHSTGCKNESAARAFCENLLAEGQNSGPTMVLAHFADDFFIEGRCQFLSDKKSDGHPITPKLAQDYRAYLDNYILPYFGQTKLAEITTASIRRWRNAIMDRSFVPATLRTGKPPAAETINKVVRIFKIVLDYAEDEEFITKNPINKIDFLSRESYKRRDILTKDEIKLLFPKDDKELLTIWGTVEKIALIHVLITSGMRSGEVRALKWTDVDWENNGIKITKAIKEDRSIGTTKSGTMRGTILPKQTIHYLKQWKETANCPENEFIFQGQKPYTPASPQKLRDAFLRGLKKVGINQDGKRNLVIHSLRHTYNTTMLEVMDPADLRSVVGHSSEVMTMRYSHQTPENVIKIVKKRYKKTIDKIWE